MRKRKRENGEKKKKGGERKRGGQGRRIRRLRLALFFPFLLLLGGSESCGERESERECVCHAVVVVVVVVVYTDWRGIA